MAKAEKSNSLADAGEPVRKDASSVPKSDSSIDGKPEKLYGEVIQSRQPTATPRPPNSPPPLPPNLSHYLASASSALLQ